MLEFSSGPKMNTSHQPNAGKYAIDIADRFDSLTSQKQPMVIYCVVSFEHSIAIWWTQKLIFLAQSTAVPLYSVTEPLA